MAQLKKFAGRVVKEPFAQGSKSEHDAVMLVSGTQRYVLRRQGGNAFQDPDLDALVGKQISGSGFITGYTLIMSDWAVH